MHSVKSTRGRPYSKELKALAQALAQRKFANDCNFHLVPFDSPSSSTQYRPTRHEKERERDYMRIASATTQAAWVPFIHV